MKQGNQEIKNQGSGEPVDFGLAGARIAITGTGGRLGGALKRLYSGQSEVVSFDRASLDLRDTGRLREVLESTRYDVLINPAAMTSVDQCETEEEAAEAVNALAPGIMAEVCRAFRP